jgi:hypothetical protein
LKKKKENRYQKALNIFEEFVIYSNDLMIEIEKMPMILKIYFIGQLLTLLELICKVLRCCLEKYGGK